ncbi:MAG: hypothetical protein NDJ89_05530 [Oligoflexia bacterium]|nr:hypothetical protein [Oligoflexia bacterium]
MSISGKSRALAILGVTGFFFLRALSSWAVEAGSLTTPSVGSQLPPDLFSPEVAQRTAQAMTQCFNVTPELNQLKSLSEGGTSALGGCLGLDINEDIDLEVSCDAFAGSDGQFSSSKFEEKLTKMKGVKTSLSCKKAKFDRLSSDMNCMRSQAAALQAKTGSLQKYFEQNLQRMRQDVQQIQAAEKDRGVQLEETQRLLGDDKDSGREGLVPLMNATEKMLGEEIPSAVEDARQKVVGLAQMKKAHEEGVAARKMTLTKGCFVSKPSSAYRCQSFGKPMTAREYVLCRYGQNQRLTKSGQIQYSQLVTKRAASNQAGLESVLDAIFGESVAASAPIDPKSPNAEAQLSKTVAIFSIDDIEKRYGSRLRSFDGNGLSIHDFVMKTLRGCYGDAEKAAMRELKSAGFLGDSATRLKLQESMLIADSNKKLERFSSHYGKVMSALTGQNLPLNTQACKAGAPSVQVTCLEDLKKNLEGLYHGNVPQSTIRMQVKGTNPATYINLNCQGLRGCVTALQNTMSGLRREVQRIGEYKKDYVTKANGNFVEAAMRYAQTLSPESGMIAQRIAQMNQTLSTLGLPPLETEDVKGEELKPDERYEGLYGSPRNVLGFVGAKMTPPLIDLSGRGLSSSMDRISRAQREMDRKADEVGRAIAKAEGKKKGCMKQDLETELSVLRGDAQKFATCASKTLCKDRSSDTAVGKLLGSYGDMNDFLQPYGAKIVNYSVDIQGVLDGFGDGCKKIDRRKEELEKKLSGIEDELKNESNQKDPGVMLTLKTKAQDYGDELKKLDDDEAEPSDCNAVIESMNAKRLEIVEKYGKSDDSGGEKATP